MRSLLLIAAMLMLVGCASSPQAKFYTLAAVPPSEHVKTASPIVITIDSVTVPALIDRPQIVVRVDATQVRIDEFARWADPLKSQIPRVVAADLAQSVQGALVSTYPQPANDAQTYHVWLDVQSFESALGDMASIDVLWSVRSPKPGAVVSGRTVAHESAQAQGYDGLVDAHSRALATVSGDIAGAIRATLRP